MARKEAVPLPNIKLLSTNVEAAIPNEPQVLVDCSITIVTGNYCNLQYVSATTSEAPYMTTKDQESSKSSELKQQNNKHYDDEKCTLTATDTYL